MQAKTAVVIGATGLTGMHVVQQLLRDPQFSKVRILVRRKPGLSDPRLDVLLTDFSNLPQFRDHLGTGNCLFCCLGTTLSQVRGNRTLYKQIDHGIAVTAAQMAADAGFTHYLLVSALGANPRSSNFYLRLKGTIEHDIAQLGLPSFHAFRPGMLYGRRHNIRLSETIGKVFMKAVDLLLVGKAARLHGIQGSTVAQAMVTAAKDPAPGVFVHHYPQMVRMSVG